MSDEKALMRRLLSYTRKAVEDYNLIQENDRVCVGLSGGKDSLALLCVLAALRRFYPKKFQLSAATVSLGFPGTDFTQVSELCRKLDVPYRIINSQIAEILFEVRKESNPCALCANLRRGALNDAAKEMGCNVVALAHHREDIIETAMLALMYEGRFYCFPPKTWLDRAQLNIIRPFLYVEESLIRQYKTAGNLPVVFNPCPMDKTSKRAEVKALISQLSQDNHQLPVNIFGAVKRGLWPEIES